MFFSSWIINEVEKERCILFIGVRALMILGVGEAETICPNRSARMFSKRKPRNKNYILHTVYMATWIHADIQTLVHRHRFLKIFVLITLRNLFFPILPELFARIWFSPNFLLWGSFLLPPPARTPMTLFHISLHVNAFANERKFNVDNCRSENGRLALQSLCFVTSPLVILGFEKWEGTVVGLHRVNASITWKWNKMDGPICMLMRSQRWKPIIAGSDYNSQDGCALESAHFTLIYLHLF